MGLEIFSAVARMVYRVFGWFDDLLLATGMWPYYISAVFVAMVTGFLLMRFGSALSLGSDKAAPAIKSATYRGKYRVGAKRKPVGSRGRYERK